MKGYDLLQERETDEIGSKGVWDISFTMAWDILNIALPWEHDADFKLKITALQEELQEKIYNNLQEFKEQILEQLKESEAENIPLAALKLLGLKPQQFVKIKNILFGNDIIFKVTTETKKQYFYLKSYECEFTEEDFVKLILGKYELEFDDKKTFCRAYMDAKAEMLGL